MKPPRETPCRIASAICVHDDNGFLDAAIRSVLGAGPCFVFVSRIPWAGSPGNWEETQRIALEAGAEVVSGDWGGEREHREAALANLRERGFRYAIILDGDEVLEAGLLGALCSIAREGLADAVHVRMATYWKMVQYVIRPPEALTPVIMVDLERTRLLFIREFEAERRLVLSESYGVLHHLSYVGPNERIVRKLSTFSHKDEVVDGWFQRVWLGWDENKLMRDLHPTHPEAYQMVERIPVPEPLLQIAAEPVPPPSPTGRLPKTVSFVIPVHGNREDLRRCLESLTECGELVSEVIVVDNASPDDAAEVAGSFPFVRLFRNVRNEGFPKACNQGLEASSGEAVVFLNSDTVVPKVALGRLLETLWSSGSVAASGPYTNNAGHLQRIDHTYTSLETLGLFAEDFARRDARDHEVDMLVGFCLAARRSALDEVGGFDERFGLGTFEDNDLCYRMIRAGYRLLISSRSFVHHHGSRTLGALPGWNELLSSNERLFRAKWQGDLATGFASSLSGLQATPIVFNQERHPDRLAEEIRTLAARARVSLCMIVRNEERVLEACLESAKPFFSQIVVVDTGSTDRTLEICRSHGVELHEHPWEDSFSEARNHSLGYATGDWVFWMDADDTLPAHTGESLLRAALAAPASVAGYVVPVQFVEEGPGGGTRVDHVKLFRRFPDLRFEGRIHEQILASLRPHGEIARLDAVVLHSGYDVSEEGQKRKRVRDHRLLELDLKERPNHPFVLFNCGMTTHFEGAHKAAVNWLKQCLAVSKSEESHVRKAYAFYAGSLRELGKPEEALKMLELGLEAVGDDAELHFQKAVLLSNLGRLEEARESYLAIPDQIGDHFSSVDIGILGCKRFHNLGVVCRDLGRCREAKDWFTKALQLEPTFLASALGLFDAALAEDDLHGARWCLDHVLKFDGPRTTWLNMGVRYAEGSGGAENVVPWLERAAREHPWSIELRMALARRLLDESRVQEAMPILMELQAGGSAEAAFCLGVVEIRGGRYRQALLWMERALTLNPGHEETTRQIDNLRRAIAESSS